MASKYDVISRGGVTLQDPSFIEGLYKAADELTSPKFWAEYEAQQKYDERQDAKMELEQQKFKETKEANDLAEILTLAQNERELEQDRRNKIQFEQGQEDRTTKRIIEDIEIGIRGLTTPEEQFEYLSSVKNTITDPRAINRIESRLQGLSIQERSLNEKVTNFISMLPGMRGKEPLVKHMIRSGGFEVVINEMIKDQIGTSQMDIETRKFLYKSLDPLFSRLALSKGEEAEAILQEIETVKDYILKTSGLITEIPEGGGGEGGGEPDLPPISLDNEEVGFGEYLMSLFDKEKSLEIQQKPKILATKIAGSIDNIQKLKNTAIELEGKGRKDTSKYKKNKFLLKKEIDRFKDNLKGSYDPFSSTFVDTSLDSAFASMFKGKERDEYISFLDSLFNEEQLQFEINKETPTPITNVTGQFAPNLSFD